LDFFVNSNPDYDEQLDINIRLVRKPGWFPLKSCNFA
jgi:hypothetical protein